MDLYGKEDKSIPQKIVLTVLEIVILVFSYWILFDKGYSVIFSAGRENAGNETRHLILFVFNCIVFARILITVFYLLKRKIPWDEAFSIPFAFAVYYIGYAMLGYESKSPAGIQDFIGIIFFTAGSFLNTVSELQRNKWKKSASNKGHLFRGGLFKYSMHINYFGDLLWVTGYAFVTHNPWSILIPVMIFCFFAFYNIPKLDAYLASKYKGEFNDYRQSTRKFIPFIY